MNRSESRSHVCDLDVVASAATLLPRGILRKAGKEEEKPWEINLANGFGSRVPFLGFWGSKRARRGFLLFQSRNN